MMAVSMHRKPVGHCSLRWHTCCSSWLSDAASYENARSVHAQAQQMPSNQTMLSLPDLQAFMVLAMSNQVKQQSQVRQAIHYNQTLLGDGFESSF